MKSFRGIFYAAAAVILSLPAFTLPAQASRGRPTIQGTTLVSDTGHLLRAAFWSTDLSNTAPSDDWVASLKTRGFNALHLYAEAWNPNPPPGPGGTPIPGATPVLASQQPGYATANIRKVVDQTRSNGLYLIITIGNGYSPGGSNYDFAKAFWKIYAPMFKDETHVIYEIYNEPYVNWGATPVSSAPSSDAVRMLEKDMFTLIRQNAPNTPVLLFTYALFRTQAGLLSQTAPLGDLRWADANIKDPNQPQASIWQNTAIALHGYSGVSATSGILSAVLTATRLDSGQGFPCMVTEFANNDNTQDTAETIAFEDQKVSWLTFVVPNNINNDFYFKNPINQNGIVWVADYGTWPATSSPPVSSQVGIKSVFNQLWVTTGLNPAGDPLVASKTAITTTAEKFSISPVVGSRYYIGLKSQSLLKFADADPANFYLIPNRNFATSAKMEWMTLPDGTVALKTYSNNKFVSVVPNGTDAGKLIANKPTVSSTEKFTFLTTP